MTNISDDSCKILYHFAERLHRPSPPHINPTRAHASYHKMASGDVSMKV